MKISARNALKGKIRSILSGTVNAEVVIELPGGQQIVSMITQASVRNLGLAEGKDAFAVIKASDVMVGVEH